MSEPAPNAKRCHWCGVDAAGTALAAMWENGRVASRLGGRFASCGEHGFAFYVFRFEEEAR